MIEELRVDLTDIRGLDVDPAVGLRATGGRDGLATLTVDDFVGAPVGPADGPDAVAVKRRGCARSSRSPRSASSRSRTRKCARSRSNPVVPPPPCVPDPCIENPPPLPPPVVRGPAELPPTFGIDELFLIQSEMILQCERLRDRFALLDPPFDASTSALAGIRGIGEWRSRVRHEVRRVVLPVGEGRRSAVRRGRGDHALVPPSGHVAGVVAGDRPRSRRAQGACQPSHRLGGRRERDRRRRGARHPERQRDQCAAHDRRPRLARAGRTDRLERHRLAVRQRPPADLDDREGVGERAAVGRVRAQRRVHAGAGDHVGDDLPARSARARDARRAHAGGVVRDQVRPRQQPGRRTRPRTPHHRDQGRAVEAVRVRRAARRPRPRRARGHRRRRRLQHQRWRTNDANRRYQPA